MSLLFRDFKSIEDLFHENLSLKEFNNRFYANNGVKGRVFQENMDYIACIHCKIIAKEQPSTFDAKTGKLITPVSNLTRYVNIYRFNNSGLKFGL